MPRPAHSAALVTPACHQPARNVLSDSPDQGLPSHSAAPHVRRAIPPQAWPSSDSDHATTPMQSIRPASGNSRYPLQSSRGAIDQRGVLANEDEPSLSQPRMSQAVDRPSVPGFSRGAVRQMGVPGSQRPSLLGMIMAISSLLEHSTNFTTDRGWLTLPKLYANLTELTTARIRRGSGVC